MFSTARSIAAILLAFASAGFPAVASASDYDDVFRERYDSPEDVGVLGRFVSKAVEVGQYDQAISTLEQHLVKFPRDARARLNLARVYANTGSWELAARNLEIALSVGDLTPEETEQAEQLAARVKGSLSGFEWVLDMTVGIRSKWLDVKDERFSWKDRQDWNPFAAVNTALKIDLDTPLNDVLVVSASGLVERRYEDINQGGDDPFTSVDEFAGIGGIYAHHRGRIAVTLDKGVPVVDLDAMRVQISAFGQFRTYNPSVTEVALGTSVRLIVQPSVSADLISRVTDAVLEEVSDWQNRALEPVYPIVFLDALRVKIRDAESRQVKNKAVYVALGVTPEGEREVLGLWIANNEGAKFWLSVMNNLRNRGVEDILIAVVDGLKGFPDAINAAFPETTVQTCIVHLVRHSLNFCGWKDRKNVAKDLKRIYQATDDVEAEKALADFEAIRPCTAKYPTQISASRRT